MEPRVARPSRGLLALALPVPAIPRPVGLQVATRAMFDAPLPPTNGPARVACP